MKKHIAVQTTAYKLFYATMGKIMQKKEGYVTPTEAMIELCEIWQKNNAASE